MTDIMGTINKFDGTMLNKFSTGSDHGLVRASCFNLRKERPSWRSNITQDNKIEIQKTEYYREHVDEHLETVA